MNATLEDSVERKTVRLDVYDPLGNVLQPFNSSFTKGEPDSDPYPLLSDIQVKVDNKGQFFYRIPLGKPYSGGGLINGTYTIDVSYDGVTRNETFAVR